MKKVVNVFGESFFKAGFIIYFVVRTIFLFVALLSWYVTYALMLSIAMPFLLYEREIYMARHNDVFYNFPKQAKRTIAVWLYSALSLSSFIFIAMTGALPLWTLFIITALQFGVYVCYAFSISSFGALYSPFLSSPDDLSTRSCLERMHCHVLEYKAKNNLQ